MRKRLLFSAVVFAMMSFVGGAIASATTYLETDKNYYTDTQVTRGFLDHEISESVIGQENWEKFQVAVAKQLVTYTPGMTFNQYYLANGISPEDNFQVYRGVGINGSQDILLPSGGYLNSNPNPKGFAGVDYITYVGPSHDRGAYWGDRTLEDPILFSRLTVGQPSFGVFDGTNNRFPVQIGYGEQATVMDYMLVPENDVVIPARFNTKRDDLYLTMRSRGLFGADLKGAQVFLDVTRKGETVVGSGTNPKSYIDTTTKVLMTDKTYEQMGLRGKLFSATAYRTANRELTKIGVDQFSSIINKHLQAIQSASGANTIVSGNGGQIQLTGFYRQSNLDDNYTSSAQDREADALDTVNVVYYMYTAGADVTVTTPLASNGKHLYSSNESVFTIETTRPYFTDFGDLSSNLTSTTVLDDFEKTLGAQSFKVIDAGIKKDGESIGVDTSRIRIRVSLNDGTTYEDKAYTFDELKDAFVSKAFPVGEVKLVYTYAAPDAKEEIIGKLPSEIEDNQGAYAVPFVRSVEIEAERYGIHYHFESADATLTLPQEVMSLLPVDNQTYTQGQEITLQRPSVETVHVSNGDWEFIGYPSDKVTIGATDAHITGTWRFLPTIPKGTVIIQFVDEAGSLLKTETPLDLTDVNAGTPYDVTNLVTDEIEVNGKTYTKVGVKEGTLTGSLVAGNNLIVVTYKEKPAPVPPTIKRGTVILQFVDAAGTLLKTEMPSQYTNVEVDTPYDITALAIDEVTINGKTYTKQSLISGSLIGTIVEGNNVIVIAYHEKPVVTPPAIKKGSVTVRFVDTNGIELKVAIPVQDAVEGTPYDVSNLAIDEIKINGKTYVKKGLKSGAAKGTVVAGNTDVVFEYMEKKPTTPPIIPPTTSQSTVPSETPPTSSTPKTVVVKPRQGNQVLPRTGESSSMIWLTVGLTLLISLWFLQSKSNKKS